MDHMWVRIGSQLVARVTGPMKFRLVLQPDHGGVLRDSASRGWQMRELASRRISGLSSGLSFTWPTRVAMLKYCWKSVGRVFMLAVVLDVVYQIIELRFVYPGEALIVAFVLAIVPYLILRGLVRRLARWNYAKHHHNLPATLGSSR